MENEQVTRRAARQLREAARAVETIVRTRGDDTGVLRARVDAFRETADQLDTIPGLSSGTKTWNKGMHDAMAGVRMFAGGVPRNF